MMKATETDQAFAERRQFFTDIAAGPDKPAVDIDYLPWEDQVWTKVSTALEPVWDAVVVPEVLEAREALDLPTDHVPQLSAVTERLKHLSGFTFRAVDGLIDGQTFFGGLADHDFMSTQYIRRPENPFYTREPDIVHEVRGHGTLLANPAFAKLHELAGQAHRRVESPEARECIERVWWFSGEFGIVLSGHDIKAVGAGLLSSVGELANFRSNAAIRPFDIRQMGRTGFLTDVFQSTLFAATSVHQLLEETGAFFAEVDEERVQRTILAAS